MSNINIKKRDGSSEPLDVNKIHKVVEFACEGLTGVSSSQVEMSSHIQFYDGMSSDEIQEIMIKSANDLISLENPNYQYVASRLLLYATYKDVYGEFDNAPLMQMIKTNIDRGVYDPDILAYYSEEERMQD
jgi:ribonucleoside-diphosphate reductase alpha chain